MIRLNIHEAKTHLYLSRYLSRLEEGETIVLCRRNVPIAEIHPLAGGRGKIPAPGMWKGRLTVPDSFFEPLPQDLLDAFTGRDPKAH